MQRCLKPVLSSRKAAECSGGARVFAGRWHSAMPPGYVSGLAGLCHLRCTYCSARTFGPLIDTLRLDTCIYICICTYDIYICYIDIREGAHMCLFTAASQAPRCKARTHPARGFCKPKHEPKHKQKQPSEAAIMLESYSNISYFTIIPCARIQSWIIHTYVFEHFCLFVV